jgi:hypothetical protein
MSQALKWYHKIGLKIVDLFILAIALLFVTTSAIERGDVQLFAADFWTLCLIVFVTYVAVVVFVKFLTFTIPGEGRFSSIAKTVISGLLVYFLYPYIIGIIMFVLGFKLAVDLQLVLMIVSLLRTIVRTLLSRYWEMVP